ncbi:hypothetical protein, partial [Bacillus sp. SIMBA_033]|uniref:hypothetical protein n=1 Tax=Bacillus sp. SIMBA_033 TaxID=3085776 RepID=UPI00397CD4D0
ADVDLPLCNLPSHDLDGGTRNTLGKFETGEVRPLPGVDIDVTKVADVWNDRFREALFRELKVLRSV